MAIRLPSPISVLAGGVLIAALTMVLSGPLQADQHEVSEPHATSHTEAAAKAKAKAEPDASADPVVLYESGVHYEELVVPVSTSDPEKIEVVEMFSYLCIHVSAETHDALFEAVHNAKKDTPTPLSPEALGDLFNKVAGVEQASFMKAFNSFSVRSKVQQASSRARQVRLQSVPTLVVNGKYKTNSSMAGTNVGMLQVVDFLVEKERAAAAAASAEKAETAAEAASSE